MPSWHGILTLSGSAQKLSSIAGSPGDLMKQIDVSAGEANTAIVYGGGVDAEWMLNVAAFVLTSSIYGWRLEIPVENEAEDPIPDPPFRVVESSIGILSLAEIQVLGTENNIVHVFAVW